jgi:hypothetical protein
VIRFDSEDPGGQLFPVRRFFKIIYSLAVVVLFLAVAVLGFTQTRAFRSYMRSQLIETVHKELGGELSLGTIEGNLVSGFHVDNVVLRKDGEAILTVPSVEARYDPFSLIARRIAVSRITLTKPFFSLTRSTAGSWTIGRLLKSSPGDTVPSSWAISLKQVQLIDGGIRIVDSLALVRRSADSSLQIAPGRFDYSNLQIDSLNLDASLTVRSREIELGVRSLSCSVPAHSFRLREFSGEASLTKSLASVKNLRVVTNLSHVELDARMDGVDVTRISDLTQLRQTPVSAKLTIDYLECAELARFIGKPVKFLERSVSGELDADGRFGALNIHKLALRTGTSAIQIAGTLSNLHHPSDLEMDLASLSNAVSPDDIRLLMPSLGIPDLSRLEVVNYDVHFKGKPTVFNARLSSTSKIGSLDVDANLDMREGTLSYDGTIRTKRLDLAPASGDSTLTSSLNMTVSVQGHGARLAEMTSIVRAEIDSSSFYRLPVNRSVVVVDIADRALRPRVSLRIGSARIDLGGALTLMPRDLVGYDLTGRINTLNLAELTRSRRFTSDLSFDLQARGQIKTIDALSGTFDVNLFRSTFDTVQFAGGPATIRINTLNAEPRSFEITSDILDLSAKGRLTPISIFSSVVRGASLAGEAFRERISRLDSIRGSIEGVSQRSGPRMLSRLNVDSTGYTFTLSVKDCYPVGVVLGREIEGQVALNGRVYDGPAGISMAGEVTAPEFHYADSTVTFAAWDGEVAYTIDGLSSEHLLRSMGLSVGVKAKRFDIEGLRTANVSVNAVMQGDSSSYQAAALLDSLVTVRLKGTGLLAGRFFAFDLDRVAADFNSQLFESAHPVQLLVGRDGLEIRDLLLRRDTEELGAHGIIDPTGNSEITCEVRALKIGSLPKMLRGTIPIESLPAMAGVVNATGSFRGSFESPQFSVNLNAAGVKYEGEDFGRVAFQSSYANRLLNIFAQLQSQRDTTSSEPELLINGTVPYDLTMRGRANTALEGEMNLDVRSNNCRLEILDPFISELTNLRGTVISNMRLRGSVQSPSYEGSLTLRNAQFLFEPLGIQYVVDGKFVPSGQQIALEDVVIKNIAQDRPDGKVAVSGSFSLQGLTIKDFDLLANGQLLVMKETGRRMSGGLYGDLFAGTGQGGVRWNGSPSRSFATGGVFIKYGNLTLPPTRQADDLPDSRIDVRVIDDRSEKGPPVIITTPKPAGIKSSASSSRPTKAVAPPSSAAVLQSKSFLDNIVYNLTLESQGVMQLRFIFNNFTNEQLLAELQGRTAFARDGDAVRLTGELQLGNRSYYNYFKKLGATGKLKFTGNPLNPELDVVASHEGVHRGARDTITSALAGSQSGVGASEKVVVRVFITGTREQPKVKMGLERYDHVGNIIREERGDVEGDAMAFLVTGTFRDELTQQDRLSLAGSSVLGGMASSILSGPLTDLLRKEFGIVRSVDVLYYGGSFQESADVRLTGELGEAVFRLGGRVLSDLNNTNVSIQLPMSAIIGSEKLRNLVLQAERTVQGVETVDQRRESKGVRLLYRIIF